MSDGITDAKRECKPIKYILPKTPPTRCKGCVFITCSPPDAQWECMNPIDTELLDKDNTCIYHLTAGELAEYCRRRLMTKLKGGSKVQKSDALQCKHLLDDGECSKIDDQCPFIGMAVNAEKLCKHYEFNIRYEVHVLGNSTSIIGVFKTREQAEQFIRDNVKVVEMIP